MVIFSPLPPDYKNLSGKRKNTPIRIPYNGDDYLSLSRKLFPVWLISVITNVPIYTALSCSQTPHSIVNQKNPRIIARTFDLC